MSSNPLTNVDTNVLDEIDLIWGGNHDVQSNEWSKLDQDFTNAGYREGITAGKQAALQEGFDDGFARVGVPLGRELGLLRGAASAAMSLLSSSTGPTEWGAEPGTIERCKDEVKAIANALGRIHLEDVAPPDMEAERHAQEHLDRAQTTADVDVNHHNVPRPAEQPSRLARDEVSATTKPAVEELIRLRETLVNVFQDLGLDVALT